jgi:filamentous hemagglutinin family protein
MACLQLKKLASQFCLSGGVFFYCLTTTSLSQAQITNDDTLSTDVNTPDNLNFKITGGRQTGGNLFHSFSQFSVPTGGLAIFDNALDVQNIFSRVTGGSVSNIDGLIQANGSSNLFLLNPNGIIFGSNAQLNIGGSFIATTANQIDFTDDSSFSATDLQSSPLLTVSIPIGLQFGETAGRIVNQSIIEDSSGFSVGLQVQPGKTLALVGGDIFLDGGGLFAPGGRIELGSVAGSSFVSLTPIAKGWALEYENVQNFQDIKLSQGAFIDSSGESPGNILLKGKRITITDNSVVANFNFGVNPGGSIVVKASESLEVSDFSEIDSNTFSTGSSGDIIIETKKLIVRNRSFIDTSNQGDGQGGNLTVNAFESVEVDGSSRPSALTTQTFGNRDAGDLRVTTPRLILRDGGQINSSTRESGGNGGSIIVNASESVEVSGQGIMESGEVVPSGLFTRTEGDTTFGSGGNLNINTGRLSIRDGGTISVAAVEGSTGRAGNLEIDANSLSLNQGTITAETAQTGGDEGANITLKISDLLRIENQSQISATANGLADGGNIDIDAGFVIAFPNQNNDIIARAAEGTGGKIDIATNGIFGIEERSSTPINNSNDIDPSSEFGLDGTVNINELDVNPAEGLEELPTSIIDVTKLVAQNLCQQLKGSEFIVTGTGGIAPNPSQVRNGEVIEVDLVEPAPFSEDGEIEGRGGSRTARTEVKEEIVEAQGWIINDRGNLELVVYSTEVNGSPAQPDDKICHATAP